MSRLAKIFHFLFESKYTNGLYVSVIPTKSSYNKVLSVAKKYYSDIKFVSDPHITLVYSKVVISDDAINKAHSTSKKTNVTRTAKVVKVEWWPGHDRIGYLVLQLESTSLDTLNKIYTDAGYTAANYNKYKPHITLATNLIIDKSSPELIQLNNELSKLSLTIDFGPDKLDNLKM